MKPSIGLLGANGAGKSTIADYLVQEHGYRKLSFASALRELAELNTGWKFLVDDVGYTQAKLKYPEVRQYLIDLGEGIRKYDPVYFVKALAQQITDMDPDRPWVVDDVRKQVEVNFLHSVGFRFIGLYRDAEPFDLGELVLPTEHLLVHNNTGKQQLAYFQIDSHLRMAEWALGKEVKADDATGGTPVLEQPDPDQGGEGLPAAGDGEDLPHWCSRCEAEWVRWGNFFPPAVGEARARWHADESRRGRDEVERHGGVATLRDGEAGEVRGDPAGSGGLVSGAGDEWEIARADRI